MTDEAILAGARSVSWPARLEIVQVRPWVVLDCAHNPQSVEALAATLPGLLEYDELILVLGVSDDKDAAGMAEAVAPITDIAILTGAASARALPVDSLEALTGSYWPQYRTAATSAEAMALAYELAGPRDCIVVTGSFYLLDEYLQLTGATD